MGLFGFCAGCGDDTSLPPPPPPALDAGVVGPPVVTAITRTDPQGCQAGVRSNVVLTALVTNVLGVAHFAWGTLSGSGPQCDLVSGGDQQTATFSCPNTDIINGSITVSGDNGPTTAAFTMPICGQPVRSDAAVRGHNQSQ
jgi:hypothetical protein